MSSESPASAWLTSASPRKLVSSTSSPCSFQLRATPMKAGMKLAASTEMPTVSVVRSALASGAAKPAGAARLAAVAAPACSRWRRLRIGLVMANLLPGASYLRDSMPAQPLSSQRRRRQPAALAGGRVGAAREPGRAAEIALEDLAVIADLAQDRPAPSGCKSRRLHRVEERPDIGIGALFRLRQAAAGEAELLGIDEGEDRPAHDIEERLVAAAQQRRQRLVGKPLGQDAIGERVLGAAELRRRQLEPVARIGGATPGEERPQRALRILEQDRLEWQMMAAEIARQCRQRPTLLHADAPAGEIAGVEESEPLRHQQLLRVMEDDRSEAQPPRGLAPIGPGQAAQGEIDLLGGLELLDRLDADEAHLLRRAEQGGGDGAADIRIESPPAPVLAFDRESRDSGIDAAGELPLRANMVEGRAGLGGRRRKDQCKRQNCYTTQSRSLGFRTRGPVLSGRGNCHYHPADPAAMQSARNARKPQQSAFLTAPEVGDIIIRNDIKFGILRTMVRTVISLDADDKAWLDRKAKQERMPMTRLVRRAIKRMRKESEGNPSRFDRLLQETAGMRKLGDGLRYQRKLRREWDRK